MSRPRPRSAAERAVERRVEVVDIVMGVLGFFTLGLTASTVLAELRGEDGLGRALTLAVLVALIYVLVRIRRTLVAQQRAARGLHPSGR